MNVHHFFKNTCRCITNKTAFLVDRVIVGLDGLCLCTSPDADRAAFSQIYLAPGSLCMIINVAESINVGARVADLICMDQCFLQLSQYLLVIMYRIWNVCVFVLYYRYLLKVENLLYYLHTFWINIVYLTWHITTLGLGSMQNK